MRLGLGIFGSVQRDDRRHFSVMSQGSLPNPLLMTAETEAGEAARSEDGLSPPVRRSSRRVLSAPADLPRGKVVEFTKAKVGVLAALRFRAGVCVQRLGIHEGLKRGLGSIRSQSDDDVAEELEKVHKYASVTQASVPLV